MGEIKAKILNVTGNNTGEMKHAAGIKVTEENGYRMESRTEKGYVYIKNFRFIDEKGSSHSLKTENEKLYKRIYSLNYKEHYIYHFKNYSSENSKGIHVGLTRFQNQRFLWKQSDHWFQKEENIRYVVNILFLILGSWIAYKSI